MRDLCLLRYPCFDEHVTYGMAVTGLAVEGETFPVALSTDGAVRPLKPPAKAPHPSKPQ